MTMEDQTTVVRIQGKSLRLRYPEGKEQELVDAAEFVNDTIKRLSSATSASETERLALLASINIAHDLQTLESQTQGDQTVSDRLLKMQNKIETVLNQAQQLEIE